MARHSGKRLAEAQVEEAFLNGVSLESPYWYMRTEENAMNPSLPPHPGKRPKIAAKNAPARAPAVRNAGYPDRRFLDDIPANDPS